MDIAMGQRRSTSQHSDLHRPRCAGAIGIKRQNTVRCVVSELRRPRRGVTIDGRGKMTGIKRAGVGAVGRQMTTERKAREVQHISARGEVDNVVDALGLSGVTEVIGTGATHERIAATAAGYYIVAS